MTLCAPEATINSSRNSVKDHPSSKMWTRLPHDAAVVDDLCDLSSSREGVPSRPRRYLPPLLNLSASSCLHHFRWYHIDLDNFSDAPASLIHFRNNSASINIFYSAQPRKIFPRRPTESVLSCPLSPFPYTLLSPSGFSLTSTFCGTPTTSTSPP